MQQSNRILVLGMSGSGKTHLVANELVPAYRGKHRYLVVVSERRDELADLCEQSITIHDEDAGAAWDLEGMLRAAGSLHIELLATDPHDFLDALGRAIFALGDALLVVDEAHEFVPARNAAPGMVRLYKGGRVKNVHIITITQSLVQTVTSGLSLDAVRQSSVLVVFQQVEGNEVKRVRDEFPELGDRVRDLKPYMGDDAPAEYAVKDRKRGLALVSGRNGVEWLTARTLASAAN